MFTPHREPHPSWIEALQGMAPLRDTASHLTIRWHSGTPAAPTGRWVIFECLPADVADVFGQHAELFSEEQDAGDPLIRWARDYYDRTRTVPCPVWVVQGAEGGHPFSYTAAEAVLARAGLLPRWVPEIGGLPYAEPDQRTWAALHKRAALAKVVKDPYTARELARAVAERDVRKTLTTQATEEMREVVDEALPQILEAAEYVTREDAPKTAASVSDEHLDRYIETGDLTLTP